MEQANQAAAHLSPSAQRFLDYVTGDPEKARRLEHLTPGEYFATLQSWPTFVGAEKLAEIRRATIPLTQLVKSVPERIFGNDPRRIAAYYGFPTEAPIAIVLAPPSGLDCALVRNDYIDTVEGFKCLEVNAGQVGGWQHRYFEQRLQAHPVIAGFLRQEAGNPPHYRDPLLTMLRFIVDQNLGTPNAASGVLNVVIAMTEGIPAGEDQRLSRTYREMLAADGMGLEGDVALCSCAELTARNGQIWDRNQRPVHALVMMSLEPVPQAVFRTFKAGRLSLYNGPANRLLNDKRVLAQLSEHTESSLFTADERAVLRKYLPWTRAVGPGPATFRGETRALPDLLVAHREDIVLKPCWGFRGQGVTVGLTTPPDAWARLVAEAAATPGGWLAQERLDSRPYVYQLGEQGYGIHDVVWGTFCFGETYGGGFLRMLPRVAGERVINSARGATEGVLFEV